ncbi:MAG: vWA domain-containing protein [Mobilitalea sp.]
MRLQKLLLILVICLSGLFNIKKTDAMASSINNGIDVVIGIDTSGSMNRTDSKRISIEAAKLFIDMMDANGSRIGLVSFSDTLGTCIMVMDLNTQEDKEWIKDTINKLQYSGDTDIGLALKKCVEYLKEAGDIENSPVILFFTDGKIDLSKNNLRTVKDSEKDAAKAIDTAMANLYPIYTIGLNTNGGVDVDLIQRMADKTDGRCYTVESADKLPDIFNGIFADFINSNIIDIGTFETDGINKTEINIQIPNDSVMEANVIMLSSDTLKEVTLKAPDAKEVTINGDNAILTKSSQYSMLKILNPQIGTYEVGIKGIRGCKVHVNMVFSYKLTLAAKAGIIKDDENKDIINIEAYFETDGTELDEENIYANTKAIAGITYPKGTIMQYPMNQKKNMYSVTVPITESGIYTVVVNAENESFYRETVPVEVELLNQASTIVPTVTIIPVAEVGNEVEKGKYRPGFLQNLYIVLGVILITILIVMILKFIKDKNAQYYGYLMYQTLGGSSYGIGNGTTYSLGYCKGKQSLEKIIPVANAAGMDLSNIYISPNSKTNSGIFIINKSKLHMKSGYGANSLRKGELSNEGFVSLSSNENSNNDKLKISYSIKRSNN